MTKYEVLYWYNAETQERDIRCRSDIDKQPGFTRLLDGLVMHKSSVSGNKRLFMVAFEGSERNAKWYAETLKRNLDGLGVARSFITTEQE
jgi:hypothetical protein